MSTSITPEKLFELAIGSLAAQAPHPLHEAVLKECCENALASSSDDEDIEALTTVVQVAFSTSNTTLQAALNSAMKSADADIITLNYRDETFTIPKGSKLLG